MKSYYVDSRAVCETSSVGEGTRIWGFTHIMEKARIGKNCKLGEQVFVEGEVAIGDGCTIKNGVALWDGVTLEDHVFVGPYAVFTNDLRPRAFLRKPFLKTLVKRGATIGANSVVVCGVTVGEFAMVGAGSTVLEDVPAHALVVGNPARVVAKLCYCGERLRDQELCPACAVPLSQNSLEAVMARFP